MARLLTAPPRQRSAPEEREHRAADGLRFLTEEIGPANSWVTVPHFGDISLDEGVYDTNGVDAYLAEVRQAAGQSLDALKLFVMTRPTTFKEVSDTGYSKHEVQRYIARLRNAVTVSY